MSKWYLDRYRNPPSDIRRKLNTPPYHIHQNYEDRLSQLSQGAEELSAKVESLSVDLTTTDEFAQKLRRDHQYHFTSTGGLLKKTTGELDNKVKALFDYVTAMDARLKALESK